MSRLPALVGLLRHGPLKPAEIFEIMGGDINAAADALEAANRAGLLREERPRGMAVRYRLEFKPRPGERMRMRRAAATIIERKP